MNPFPNSELEIIQWQDAVGDSTRTHFESIADIRLAVNVNIGWVVDENENRIVLAHGRSDTGEVDHLTIPVDSILERKRVSRGRKKKR